MKRVLALLTVFALLCAGVVFAAEKKLTLHPGPGAKGAHGTAVVKDKDTDQKEITIKATGLKPDGVYTVWLVNMKPKMDMVGVGTGDFSFKADDKGKGNYTATIPTTEFAKWKMLEIAHHPDGDAKNMKNMEITLKGDVK